MPGFSLAGPELFFGDLHDLLLAAEFTQDCI